MTGLQKLKLVLLKLIPGQPPQLARDQITELLEESIRDTVSFDSHESMLLKNILGLRDITATDVMNLGLILFRLISKMGLNKSCMLWWRQPFTGAGHRGSLDDVLGFLHIKDVARCFHAGNAKDLMETIRQPIYIAPTMRTMDLLQEMRETSASGLGC